MNSRLIVPMFCSLLVACCSQTQSDRQPLLGYWEAKSENAHGSFFEFRGDGRATWHLADAFDIQYRVDEPLNPTQLDLHGFMAGPLAGRTLYCIVEVTADTLRMDCEPSARPVDFDPDQTQVFVRTTGGGSI
jgi:hypothetical protein